MVGVGEMFTINETLIESFVEIEKHVFIIVIYVKFELALLVFHITANLDTTASRRLVRRTQNVYNHWSVPGFFFLFDIKRRSVGTFCVLAYSYCHCSRDRNGTTRR